MAAFAQPHTMILRFMCLIILEKERNIVSKARRNFVTAEIRSSDKSERA